MGWLACSTCKFSEMAKKIFRVNFFFFLLNAWRDPRAFQAIAFLFLILRVGSSAQLTRINSRRVDHLEHSTPNFSPGHLRYKERPLSLLLHHVFEIGRTIEQGRPLS